MPATKTRSKLKQLWISCFSQINGITPEPIFTKPKNKLRVGSVLIILEELRNLGLESDFCEHL